MKKKGLIHALALIAVITTHGITKATSPIKHPPTKNKRHFACPTILTGNLFIQAASCHASDGGIYQIHGTGIGMHTYTWYDASNNIVGNDSTLVNVPAGDYTVSMHDESKCPAVTAGPFTVPNNTGITIYDAQKVITLTNCSNSDGGISGIQLIGASRFEWVNGADTSKVIAESIDLSNIPMGIYVLRAFSSQGCETDKSYYVGSKTIVPTIISDSVTQSTCNKINAYITTDLLIPQDINPNSSWLFTDSANNAIASGLLIYTGRDDTISTTCVGGGCKMQGLTDGTYYLKVGNPQTCLITLATYKVLRPTFAVDDSHVTVYNDTCDRREGAIGGIKWIGGTIGGGKQPPQLFYWYNQDGKVVSNFKTLFSVPAGKYYLRIVDIMGCVAYSKTYTINNLATYITPPHINNVLLCLPGSLSLNVLAPQPKTIYYLYILNANGDTTLLVQNTNGKFTRTVTQTTVFFVSASNGTCESAKTKTTVTVQEPGVLIPDTFTPNNDGINDYWDISGLQNYPGTTVNIYNRYGQLVYTSVGYSKPFDGNLNGMPLPTGTYYYTLDLKKKDCGATAGSVTIIR